MRAGRWPATAPPARELHFMSMALSKSEIEAQIKSLGVLVVDDSQFIRKIVRNLLLNVGVKEVYEASDGIAGLEAIRTIGPDIVILDWELPLLNGAELVRIVRSPDVFPVPHVPIIMLSSHGERWRVVEASRIGVNEYLVKPISAKSLFDRIVAILVKPRPIVRLGDYYGPEPRRQFSDPLRHPVIVTAPDDAPIN
jgi:two-component system, chemotaxis family, chemotaxis protein CheY